MRRRQQKSALRANGRPKYLARGSERGSVAGAAAATEKKRLRNSFLSGLCRSVYLLYYGGRRPRRRTAHVSWERRIRIRLNIELSPRANVDENAASTAAAANAAATGFQLAHTRPMIAARLAGARVSEFGLTLSRGRGRTRGAAGVQRARRRGGGRVYVLHKT